MADREYLFVYGTLLKQVIHPEYRILQLHSDFGGEGYFRGKMYSNGHYPVVVASGNADDKIYGEVYRLHTLKRVFDHLDSYEGFKQTNTEASLFLREKKEIVSK